MSSSQSEKRCFYTWKKKRDVQSESHRDVWVSRQNSPLLGALGVPRYESCFADIQWKKTTKWSFSRRKVKNYLRIWIGIVFFLYFTIDEENWGEPAKQQRKGKTERDVSLYLYFLTDISLYLLLFKFKLVILLKIIHFSSCIPKKS